jgi:hypothetical protein
MCVLPLPTVLLPLPPALLLLHFELWAVVGV